MRGVKSIQREMLSLIVEIFIYLQEREEEENVQGCGAWFASSIPASDTKLESFGS